MTPVLASSPLGYVAAAAPGGGRNGAVASVSRRGAAGKNNGSIRPGRGGVRGGGAQLQQKAMGRGGSDGVRGDQKYAQAEGRGRAGSTACGMVRPLRRSGTRRRPHHDATRLSDTTVLCGRDEKFT